MIVWINGTFGSGKTQTAHELHRRMPGTFLYDPENVGYWLRKNEPAYLQKDNFQDEALWRSVNRQMLLHLARHCAGDVIVPMTLVSAQYYDEIIGVLRREGVSVHHFVLWAGESTVRRRLRQRLEFGNSWAVQQLPGCLSALSDPRFENKIQTEGKSIPAVAEEIAGQLSLPLLPRAHPLMQRVYQLRAQYGAIR